MPLFFMPLFRTAAPLRRVRLGKTSPLLCKSFDVFFPRHTTRLKTAPNCHEPQRCCLGSYRQQPSQFGLNYSSPGAEDDVPQGPTA